MQNRFSNFGALLFFGIVLSVPPGVQAGPFSRADDTRPLPPERWTNWEVVGLDLRLGGTWLDGNVDHLGLSGEAGFSWRFLPNHSLFLSGSGAYAEFGGDTKLEKTSGSFLYAYGIHRNLNIYAYSTYAHNKFLLLDYRLTNSLGLCVHSFLPSLFDPILFSAGATHEHETFDDDTTEQAWRPTLRLNFELAANTFVRLGADLFYVPALEDFSDYRVYAETYAELKITKNIFSFRITAADEYDSLPREGVEGNDLMLLGSVVIRTGR